MLSSADRLNDIGLALGRELDRYSPEPGYVQRLGTAGVAAAATIGLALVSGAAGGASQGIIQHHFEELTQMEQTVKRACASLSEIRNTFWRLTLRTADGSTHWVEVTAGHFYHDYLGDLHFDFDSDDRAISVTPLNNRDGPLPSLEREILTGESVRFEYPEYNLSFSIDAQLKYSRSPSRMPEYFKERRG